VGLIALYSSNDHISLAGHSIAIQQQWGIPYILASVATVFVVAEGFCEVVAQLATRSRDRAAHEADRERNRAAEERERQAERAKRQRQSLAELRRSALLSARFQLDPSSSNRERLRIFLALMERQAWPE